MINWKELVYGYNNKYERDYKDEKEMIIFETRDINLDELSYRLGVSDTSLKDKRKKLNIIPDRKNSKKQKFINLHKSGKMKNMDVKQIMKETGIKDKGYISKLVKQYNAEFSRMKDYIVKKINGKYVKEKILS